MKLQLHWSISGFRTRSSHREFGGVTEFKLPIATDEATEAWFKQHVEQLVTMDLLTLLFLSLARPADEQCKLVKARAALLGIAPPASALLYEAAALDFLERSIPETKATHDS